MVLSRNGSRTAPVTGRFLARYRLQAMGGMQQPAGGIQARQALGGTRVEERVCFWYPPNRPVAIFCRDREGQEVPWAHLDIQASQASL